MAKNIVVVGCKLPNGIVLDLPNSEKTVTLNGRNKAVIIGSDYGITDVDAEFWEAWHKVNKKFPAVVSGAIFVAATRQEADAKAKEFADRETGLEPMKTDGKDKRAKGVKTKNDKD